MKKSELVEIIKAAVKEEISNTLPTYLMEILAERLVATKEPLQETVEQHPAAVPTRKPIVGLESPLKQAPAKTPKTYVKDPVLNKILNETTGGVPQEGEILSENTAIDLVENLTPEVLEKNPAVKEVANALKKDYSSFMKAMDKASLAKRK